MNGEKILRRKDRETTDFSDIERIIKKSEVLRIALSNDNSPYIVPVNYGYEPGKIYVHSADSGTKIDILRKNDRVCFETDLPGDLVVDHDFHKCTMLYESVVGNGHAVFVEKIEEKRHALDLIMKHYGSKPFDYKEESLNRITIIRIDIEKMIGKANS